MSIIWLGDTDSKNPRIVGGKASNIGSLASHYKVPPGFIVTPVSLNSLKGDGFNVPAQVLDKIIASYYELSSTTGTSDIPVAVRSSALDEDGHSLSFAGQYDTYLNVIGKDNIANAVSKCWQSAHTERAMAYKVKHSISEKDETIPVIIQQMIPSDTSAVVFSKNPVNGNTNEIYINATFGLGESLVDGTVNPDTYVVSKDDLKIISRTIGIKTVMTALVESGTKEIALPSDSWRKQSIDDSQVLELASIAIELESQMGWAIDIEIAYKDTELYVLQCRPITN
jgi:pyruvate,water dikinase